MKRVKDNWIPNDPQTDWFQEKSKFIEGVQNKYWNDEKISENDIREIENIKKESSIRFDRSLRFDKPDYSWAELSNYAFRVLKQLKTKKITGDIDWNDFAEDAKDITGINVSDSRKVKDAENTQDVLDGILMIAFNDGEEEDGYNEVKSHANEQGEIDGVKYETYDTDNQDGVTLIDLCAMTDDANGFVKALLEEWGIIDNVADIEFEPSDNMKEAVSDSRKIKDHNIYTDDAISKWESQLGSYDVLIDGNNIVVNGKYMPVEYNREYTYKVLKTKILSNLNIEDLVEWLLHEDKTTSSYTFIKDRLNILDYIATNGKPYIGNVSDSRRVKDSGEREVFTIEVYDKSKEEWNIHSPYAAEEFFSYDDAVSAAKKAFAEHSANGGQIEVVVFGGEYVDEQGHYTGDAKPIEYISDSRRVSDMTKPVRWKGYAESVRAKRRNKKQEAEEELDEKQDVADSKIEDKLVASKTANPMAENAKGVGFMYKKNYRLNKEDIEELDEVVEEWSKEKFGEVIFDSRKVKDNWEDDGATDYWEEYITRKSMEKRLPRGWEKRWSDEYDEYIYVDEDYNEYVKDEYGKFVCISEEDF